MWNHFIDTESELFYYTSDRAENLIARKHELTDNVIPASNSVMAHVLYDLGILFENIKYTQMAEKMANKMETETVKQGVYYANWAMLLGRMVYPLFEVALLGAEAVRINLEIQKNYLPSVLFAGGTSENLPLLQNRLVNDKTTIYVCEDKSCHLPVLSSEEAFKLIRQKTR